MDDDKSNNNDATGTMMQLYYPGSVKNNWELSNISKIMKINF